MHPTRMERLLGGSVHIALILAAPGMLLNTLIYLRYRRGSRFVYSHVRQALGLGAVCWLAGAALAAGVAAAPAIAGRGAADSVIQALVVPLLPFLAAAVPAGAACLRALRGKGHVYPLIGPWLAALPD